MRVRIYQDQLDRMPKHAAAIMRFAVKRWRQGEIVVQSDDKNKNRPLVPFTVRSRFGVTDKELRGILDAHLNNPRNYDKEQKVLNLRVELMLAELPEYFIQDLEEQNGI